MNSEGRSCCSLFSGSEAAAPWARRGELNNIEAGRSGCLHPASFRDGSTGAGWPRRLMSRGVSSSWEPESRKFPGEGKGGRSAGK